LGPTRLEGLVSAVAHKGYPVYAKKIVKRVDYVIVN
jgi:hypothetical protein